MQGILSFVRRFFGAQNAEKSLFDPQRAFEIMKRNFAFMGEKNEKNIDFPLFFRYTVRWKILGDSDYR